MASPRDIRGQSRRLQRSTLQTAGVTGAMAALQGQLGAARDLPVVDPTLEAAAIGAARRSSAEAFRTRAAATGGGLGASGASAGLFSTGAAQAASGLALEGRRVQSLLRRFQLQREVTSQIAQTSQAGIAASPAAALIQADAQIKAAEIQAAAQESSAMLGIGAAVVGGVLTGGAGVAAAGILAASEEQ